MASSLRYRGFLSYSQRDKRWARKIQRALEGYRVPKGVLPGQDGSVRLGKFFRDDEDLGSAPSLGAALEGALNDSECMIVVCSPAAAQSEWVNREIEFFRTQDGNRPVFAVIVDGEPGAADPARECFPEALRRGGAAEHLSDSSGDEPLAPDVRKLGLHRAVLGVAAGILGCNLDDLIRRDARRTRRRRLIWAGVFASVAALFALMTTNLLVTRQELGVTQQELSKSNEDEDWRSAIVTNTIEGYRTFLRRWPEGTYSESIRGVLRNQESVHETYRSGEVLKQLQMALPKNPVEVEAMRISFEFDDGCAEHADVRKLYEAQTVLFTYYYLARMYLLAPAGEAPQRYFGYPEPRFHVQWIDLDPQEAAPIAGYSLANLVQGLDQLDASGLLESLANLPDRHMAAVAFFLDKALEYEAHFATTWSEDVEARLDETLVKDIFFSFADFGFFRAPDGCYGKGAYANIAKLPIVGRSTYISLRGFEEYIYSFWVRRTKEGTAAIAKRYMQLARDRLRAAGF